MEKIIVITKNELETLIQNSIRSILGEKSLKLAPDNASEKFFNINEAASFLRLATQTIYGFTSKNQIPFLKKGKRLYFKKSDLETWLTTGNTS